MSLSSLTVFTGGELHIDLAPSQHLPYGFSPGLVGYHYDQISGDSGSGARLGDFMGRVTALGETVGSTLKIDGRDISARVKVFRRFDGQNRLEGAAAFITIALPLYGQPPPQQSANPVVARY